MASLFGSIFGTGKDQSKSANRAQDAQAQVARMMYDVSRPVVAGLGTTFENFLSAEGDMRKDPIFQNQYGAMRNDIEDQYGVAKQNIIANTPGGGGLAANLAGLENQRARSLGLGAAGLANDLYNQQMSRAFAFGTGTAPVALGGFGNLASTAGGLQAAQAQQAGSTAQGLGYAAGQYLGRGSNSKSGSQSTSSSGSKSGTETAGTVASSMFG